MVTKAERKLGEFTPGMKVKFMHKGQFHNGIIEKVNKQTVTIRKPMDYSNDKVMRTPMNKIMVVQE